MSGLPAEPRALYGTVETWLAAEVGERVGQQVEPSRLDVRVWAPKLPWDLSLAAGTCPVGVDLLTKVLRDVPGVRRVRASGATVNLRVEPDAFAEAVASQVVATGPCRPAGGPRDRIAVVFSNPNVNKPLHVGHVRNNAVGMAVAGLLELLGHGVWRTCVLSDWGVHICQAMAGAEAVGLGNGDVGTWYAGFHAALRAGGPDAERLEQRAQDLLAALDRGEEAAESLRRAVVDRATAGIAATHHRIGSRFDAQVFESTVLPVARAVLRDAVESGQLGTRPDGSCFITMSSGDATSEITLARGDGTLTVYGQWLGVDAVRRREYDFDRSVVVFGDQWRPGAAAYQQIRAGLGYDWPAEHVFYGMIRLPDGSMGSRDGTAVQADALLDRIAARIGETADPAVRAVLAVGVLKRHLLAVPLAKEVIYDEGRFQREAMDAFAAVVRARRARTVRGSSAGEEARKHLALQIARFPHAAGRAAEEREPARLVRLVDALAAATLACARSGGLTAGLAAAARITLETCLGVLGIALPHPDADLPARFSPRA